jgi:hypothetical protein
VHLANRRVDLGTGRRLAPLRRPLRRAHKGQGRSESFGLPLDQCSTSRETRLLDRTSWSIATSPNVGRAPHDLPDLPLQQPVRSGTAPRSKPCPDCGGPWFRPAMIGCWPQPSDNQHSGSIPSAAVCLILRLVFLRRGAQRDERDITSLVSSTQPRSVTEPHGAFWLLLIWWCRSPGNSMPSGSAQRPSWMASHDRKPDARLHWTEPCEPFVTAEWWPGPNGHPFSIPGEGASRNGQLLGDPDPVRSIRW